MFYIFSKILSFLLSPVLWMGIALLWMLAPRKRRIRLRRTWMAVLFFYLLMNPFLTDEWIRLWEKPMSHPTQENYAAGIVLGGHMLSCDKMQQRYIFRKHTDRFLQAVLLYHQGVIDKIVISGGPGHPLHPEEREAYFLFNYLRETGIPRGDVLFEARSRNTYENAVESRKLLEEAGIGAPLLLITSAMHMRRSQAVFAKAGINVEAYVTDKLTGPRRWDAEYLLLPRLDSLIKWRLLLHELIGLNAYRLAGYG